MDYGVKVLKELYSKLKNMSSNKFKKLIQDFDVEYTYLINTTENDYLINEIIKIKEECKENNWDGYDATRINQKTVNNALIFANILISSPEVSAEPDGSIVFEWYESNTNILSISVNENIYYVQLKNNEIKSGIVRFEDQETIKKKLDEWGIN